METINCIKTRRSKRLFLDKKIPDEIINQIIECAITAPSSMDCQPWQFIIIQDKKIKQKIAESKTEGNRQHILTAPVLILVCVDTEKSPARYIEDGVTATQNILLAAHNLGLGSVYLSAFKLDDASIAQELRELLSIPKEIIPITLLPIGYSNSSEKLDEKSLLEINQIIRLEKW